MTTSIRSLLLAALVITLTGTVAVAVSQTPPAEPVDAQLQALRNTPDAAGTLIYRGAVFNQSTIGTAPLFTYERRVKETATGLAAAHITRDPSGKVIVVESAQFDSNYRLQRFDALNDQQGYAGTVLVSNDGTQLQYRLMHNGKESSRTEQIVDPVVTGPSLHGLIRSRWDQLTAGESIRVRMLVWTKLDTYGFDVRHLSQADGQDSFTITPSHFLIRLAVAPLVVVFDSHSKNLVRYEGRVPPMQQVDGKLHELDARVDYTMNVASYR